VGKELQEGKGGSKSAIGVRQVGKINNPLTKVRIEEAESLLFCYTNGFRTKKRRPELTLRVRKVI